MKRSLVAVLMAVALSAGALQTARLANQPGFFCVRNGETIENPMKEPTIDL
jgi:hypothetical protein